MTLQTPLRFALALALAAIPAPGQKPPQPAFEAASVRLEDPHDPHSSLEYTNSPQFRVMQTVFPSNRLTIRHTYLKNLINLAYGVDYGNVLGGPDWLTTQHYDLDAKVEGDARFTQEQMRPMLQNLLEERFHLKAHREPKIVPGYALTIPNGSAKLQPNKGAPSFGMFGGFNIKFQNISLESFARVLAGPLKQPVIDRTGLTGMYDFDFKFAPRESISNDPAFAEQYANLPDIFTVLQEQYGLKLVPEKITLDTLVIDHVEKIPTEN